MTERSLKSAGAVDLLRVLDEGLELPSAGSGPSEDGPVEPGPGGLPLSPDLDERRRRLRGSPLEVKKRQAFDLGLRGASVSALADLFGVDESTIYRWRQDKAREYRAQFEQQSGVDFVAAVLLRYQNLEEMLRYEIDQADTEEKEIDPATGAVRSKGNRLQSKRVKAGWIDRLLSLERDRSKVMFDSGLIRREPEKIYHTLKGEDVSAGGAEEPREITPEEMLAEIDRLARFGRRV